MSSQWRNASQAKDRQLHVTSTSLQVFWSCSSKFELVLNAVFARPAAGGIETQRVQTICISSVVGVWHHLAACRLLTLGGVITRTFPICDWSKVFQDATILLIVPLGTSKRCGRT